jgi:hypothetical protein
MLDEKERVFSFSSYSYWMEKRNFADSTVSNLAAAARMNNNFNQNKQRRQKKRKSDYEDWNAPDDY